MNAAHGDVGSSSMPISIPKAELVLLYGVSVLPSPPSSLSATMDCYSPKKEGVNLSTFAWVIKCFSDCANEFSSGGRGGG